LWSGLSLYHISKDLGTSRKVSTPSSYDAWLGIAILKGSPNLRSFTYKVSQIRLLSKDAAFSIMLRAQNPPGLCIVERHRRDGAYIKFGPLLPIDYFE